MYKRGLNKIKKKFKKRNSKNLKKIKKPHLAASAGFFFIYGKDSFKRYSDYEGAFGCLSVSFNHASVTFATGKSNIDLGAAITTEQDFAFSVSAGGCDFKEEWTNSIRSKVADIKGKIKKKAA